MPAPAPRFAPGAAVVVDQLNGAAACWSGLSGVVVRELFPGHYAVRLSSGALEPFQAGELLPAPATCPPSANPACGFYGTMGPLAAAAWPLAVAAVARATGFAPDEVALFLDSRSGRHFADDLLDLLPSRFGLSPAARYAETAGPALTAAVDAAVARWRGYPVRRAAREHGFPPGVDYLTGFVGLAVFAAEG